MIVAIPITTEAQRKIRNDHASADVTWCYKSRQNKQFSFTKKIVHTSCVQSYSQSPLIILPEFVFLFYFRIYNWQKTSRFYVFKVISK